MAVTVSAIANCDDAVLFWRIPKPIPNCWGFAIERQQRNEDGSVHSSFLDNRKGFASDDPKPGAKAPSTQWPFQLFTWADYSLNDRDVVRYRVVPMVRSEGKLVQLVAEQSVWTKWLVLSADTGGTYSAFFNRGLLISQFMSRYLEELRVKNGLKTLLDAALVFKKTLSDHELPIRRFLSGPLRVEMLQLLADVKAKKGHVFGALYELADDELVEALGKLGKNGHLVLSNGSITQKKGETASEAAKRDANQAARVALKAKKLEVNDRFTSPARLAHNKFLVFTDSKQRPLAVWTGSTNWTPTGLCTQMNNGLYVKSPELGAAYLKQWQELKKSGSAFLEPLTVSNGTPNEVKIGKDPQTLWFTPARGKVDLAAIDEVINGAQDAVLFLMFQPGASGALGTINQLLAKNARSQKKYIKGVVSTLPNQTKGRGDGNKVSVAAIGDGKTRKFELDIVQPEGIKTPFASWAATLSRHDFIPNIGYAIVHSKLIVVDPFTKPVIVVGSHNFSLSASTKNDENFLIIRDQPELARDYAAHILSVYEHFRWLKKVNLLEAENKLPGGTLFEDDKWQAPQLKAGKRELDFWVG